LIKISSLNLPFFIYKKLNSNNDKSNISSRIIKIAIISVFLGVFISLCSISIGKGLQTSIKDKLYSLNPDLVVSTYENNLRGVASERINNIEEVDLQIRGLFPDLNIEYIIEKPTLISNNNSFESMIFKGVSEEYDIQKLNKFINNSIISDKLSSNEIMISKLTADKFAIEEGEDLTLYFQISNKQRIPNVRSYSVKYIFDTDFPDFDNNYIIGNAKSLQSIFKWGFNDYSIIEISSRNNSKIIEIESSISELESIGRNNLSVKSIESKYENIFSWISIFDFNILVITILMVAVAIISVIISIFTLIFERVKMIGIMTSLGANESSLSKIFIYQGVNIILKGMIPGNIAFLITAIIQNKLKVITLNPDDYYIDSIPFVIDLTYIFSLNFIFILITSIVLSFTFVSVTKFSPILNINSQ
jgi:lipoprotein-releasing system permease protein